MVQALSAWAEVLEEATTAETSAPVVDVMLVEEAIQATMVVERPVDPAVEFSEAEVVETSVETPITIVVLHLDFSVTEELATMEDIKVVLAALSRM